MLHEKCFFKSYQVSTLLLFFSSSLFVALFCSTSYLYNKAIFAVIIKEVLADGCNVRNVTLIAFACTFISIFAKQPTVIFSPLGARAPVRRAEGDDNNKRVRYIPIINKGVKIQLSHRKKNYVGIEYMR